MNPTAQVLCKRAPDGAWEIPILGDIGFFGTNGEDLIRELQAVKPDVVKFIIYSPGGMVYDAIAVAGWIQEKGIECYAEIYGVCASAATIFAALAGPKRTAIAPGSMFLVHMPYGGDQKAITEAQNILRTNDEHTGPNGYDGLFIVRVQGSSIAIRGVGAQSSSPATAVSETIRLEWNKNSPMETASNFDFAICKAAKPMDYRFNP